MRASPRAVEIYSNALAQTIVAVTVPDEQLWCWKLQLQTHVLHPVQARFMLLGTFTTRNGEEGTSLAPKAVTPTGQGGSAIGPCSYTLLLAYTLAR